MRSFVEGSLPSLIYSFKAQGRSIFWGLSTLNFKTGRNFYVGFLHRNKAQKFERPSGGNNESKMPAIINYNNCRDNDIQNRYGDFFDAIRNHKATALYARWAATIGTDAAAPGDMKEYYKEKTKLMKHLNTFTNNTGVQLCKQPGAVIDRILWQDWLIRPLDGT